MSQPLYRVAFGAALLTLVASAAWAHAHLTDAEPPVNATVPAAPAELKLHFTEGVEAAFSGVTIADPNGKPVSGVTMNTDPADKSTMLVTVPAGLAPGIYKVDWHATAVDTHKTQGSYQFTIAAPGAKVSPIAVEQAWTRATAGNLGSGIVYATLANVGTTDDKLVAASTPVAKMAELHQTVERNGISSMPPVAGIDIKAGGRAKLSPGGLHIMLMDLTHPLKDGDTFPLTLTFAKAGKVETTVTVTKIGASRGPEMNSGDMKGVDMGGMKM